MIKILFGGSSLGGDLAPILKDWLSDHGGVETTLDAEAIAAAGGEPVDAALTALADCDGLALLAAPGARDDAVFSALAVAAGATATPILVIAWPTVDLRAALPEGVHATHFIEAPSVDALPETWPAAATEAMIKDFIRAALKRSLERDGSVAGAAAKASTTILAEGPDAVLDETRESIKRMILDDSDGSVRDPFDLTEEAASEESAAEESEREEIDQDSIRASSDQEAGVFENADAAFEEPDAAAPPEQTSESEADDRFSTSASEPEAPPPSPPRPAPAASVSAGAMPSAPMPSAPGSSGDAATTPAAMSAEAMLARAPNAPLDISPAIDRAPRRRRGAVNAADAPMERGAGPSGSRNVLAIGVALAAAAAAAYIFGERISEWLGLGAAIAAPTVGGQPAGPQGDRVEASVFAPPGVARGDVARVQVFLSTRDQRAEVRATAEEQDPSAGKRAGRPLSTTLARGAEVEVALMALDELGRAAFVIDSAQESMIWDGEPISVDFFVEARPDAPLRRHRFAAMLLRDGKPIGELRFTLGAVAAERPAFTAGPVDTHPDVYRSLFFSYAREDIDSVRLIARSYRMLEQDFFWDVDDLEPGQTWEEELERRIDGADVFILFWSRAAQQSEWVRREVEMALAREAATGAPRFLPFPIEGPPPAEPWESIAGRHIGDPLYFRAVQAARRRDSEKKSGNPQKT